MDRHARGGPGRDHGSLLTQGLAAGAALWAAGWLVLVMTPTGFFPFIDHIYTLMISPFALSESTDLLIRRAVDFVCLLPAVVLLVAGHTNQRRHRERRALGSR